MEGTSGAADLDPLRGGSGEAALGPGVIGLREQGGGFCLNDAVHAAQAASSVAVQLLASRKQVVQRSTQAQVLVFAHVGWPVDEIAECVIPKMMLGAGSPSSATVVS